MSTHGDDPNQPSIPEQPEQPGPYGTPDAGVVAGESVSFAGQATGSETVVPTMPPRKSRRGPIVAGVVALVLVAGGSAAWAVSSFLSGGGAQPESVVPATAIAYADVDLDPAAGQKIAAVRMLGKFPSTDRSGSESDLMGRVVRSLLKSDPETKIDYDADIKPWLGKRAAVAAVPSAGDAEPQALVVVQVTDEGKARTSLRKLLDEDSSASTPDGPEGLVVRDGYALIGKDQASVDAMSNAAKTSALGSSQTFIDDMKKAGDSGIASAWVDLDKATDSLGGEFLTGAALTGTAANNGGHLVAVVRIDGNAVELTAKQFGGTVPIGKGGHPGGPMLQTLPADTTGAVAVGNAGETVTAVYKSFEKLAADNGGGDIGSELEKEYGIKLPDDFATLVGTGVVVAVGDLSGEEPQVGVKVRTDDPAGSKAVLDKVVGTVEDQSDGFFDVPTIANARTPDGIAYALTSQYASALAGAGTLGTSPAFQEAVPDAATADSAAFVDFVRISDLLPADAKKDLAPLKSFGMTMQVSGADSTTKMRLVVR